MSGDILDLRTLEVDELQILADAMDRSPDNAICALLEKEFREMLAAHAGKLVFLRSLQSVLEFEPYESTDLQEAEAQFRSLAKLFKVKNRKTAQKFCETILLRCKGAFEAKIRSGA